MSRILGCSLAVSWSLCALVACSSEEQSRSFDPSKYDVSCAVDGDCLLVSSIRDCSSCCSAQAVRRESASADYEEVETACANEQIMCAMECAKVIAVCVNGSCGVK